MNIKRNISKLVSGLLCFSMIFSNVLPAYAVITENTLDGEDLSVNERNLEDITVTYKQASSFFVTIPKTIVLDGWKQSTYAVKVSGDIGAEQCVYVAPADGITDTENIDFYMKDQASENAKDDVVASVTHNKFHWNSAEVTEGYRQDDNLVEAPDLTAGAWRGIFQMEIKLETHVTHKHNYVETITKEPTCTETGEKTFTCDCGDSYTEVIPAKGHKDTDGDGVCDECGEKDSDHKHSYTETITKQPTCTETGEKTYTCKCGDSYTEVIPAKGHHYGDDDKCTGCGELNPDHKHSYTENVTKEPTCTEAGEKTYTCGCGHSYTEEIPAKGHNFVDGECTDCGKTDLYAVAPATAYSNWDYTLDEERNIITLNYYIGSETDVIVYEKYTINGEIYKTQIASNADDATYATPYMFNGSPQTNCKNIKSIIFSDSIDTSNVTNMSFMFGYCNSLIELDISNFDTSNVTDMQGMFRGYAGTYLNINNIDTSKVTNMQMMFNGCTQLESLDLNNFITNNVTNMESMFYCCYALTSLGISNFDTSNVTNMKNMFGMCKSLTSLDLSNFNTSYVTNMEYMFYQCIALESLNVSSFDTSKVEKMGAMFCDNWKVGYLDVSGFDTSKVTDMGTMFFNCQSITNLDLSNFNTNNVTMMANMFYNCRALRTIYATRGKWSTSQASTTNMFKNCGTSTVTYK